MPIAHRRSCTDADAERACGRVGEVPLELPISSSLFDLFDYHQVSKHLIVNNPRY